MADLVLCACGANAQLVTGAQVYPHRPDLHEKRFWACWVCPDSFVGCHPGTTEALGTPANAETRKARGRAHHYFDRLWKTGGAKRAEAYAWLRIELGLSKAKCHISMFDVEQCERAISACRRVLGDG